MKNNIDEKLKNIKTKGLSQREKDTLWQKVSVGMNKQGSLLDLFLANRLAINIFVAILIIFTVSVATVQASDKAKPGDVLYGIDRAVENIQIKFASQEKKDELKVKFAQERIDEVQNVIESEVDDDRHRDKIEESTQIALDYISEVRNELFEKENKTAVSSLDDIIERLQDKIEVLPKNVKLEFDIEEDGDKGEFELKFKGNKGRFELKYKTKDDGKVKIELEDKSEDKEGYQYEDRDDDRDDSIDDDTTTSTVSVVDKKIKICHMNDKEDPNSMEIYTKDLDIHLAHGDHVGECDDDDKDHEDREDDDDEHRRERNNK